MDAVKFLKEFGRMCHSYKSCNSCIMNPDNNSTGETCWVFSKSHPHETISVVEKWSSEHPAKTRLMDFLNKFPDVELGIDGYPIIFPSSLGYCGKGVKCRDCEYHGIRRTKECWDMPLDE